MADTRSERTRVFICYSRQDKDWLKRLRAHLVPLERDHKIEIWDDTEIKPGCAWEEETEQSLQAAKVAILLISADFLASEFIHANELPRLLEAANHDGAIILPVVLRPSKILGASALSRFQTVNDPSRPLSSLSQSEQEEVFVRVANRIEEIFRGSPIAEGDQPKAIKRLRPEESEATWNHTSSRRQTDDADSGPFQKPQPAVTKSIIITVVEIIAFFFVAFGSFLTNIAPPEADALFAIGISSFFALIILLFAKALSRNLPPKRYMLVWFITALTCFAIAASSAFLYKSNIDELTFAYPPESTKAEYVKGTEMTPFAKGYKERTGKTDSEVVAANGGLPNREKIWPPESLRKSKQILTTNYVVLVLGIAGAIFALTEGLIRKGA